MVTFTFAAVPATQGTTKEQAQQRAQQRHHDRVQQHQQREAERAHKAQQHEQAAQQQQQLQQQQQQHVQQQQQQQQALQALHVARQSLRVASTEFEIFQVCGTLALALVASGAKFGGIKAVHAVLLKLERPGMSDKEACTSTGASMSTFFQWRKRVQHVQLGLPPAQLAERLTSDSNQGCQLTVTRRTQICTATGRCCV